MQLWQLDKYNILSRMLSRHSTSPLSVAALCLRAGALALTYHSLGREPDGDWLLSTVTSDDTLERLKEQLKKSDDQSSCVALNLGALSLTYERASQLFEELRRAGSDHISAIAKVL